MGSLAVDPSGNIAWGYTTSNGTSPNFPGIAYSGRPTTALLNTLPQTETQPIAGAGSQVNNCRGLPCHRGGDYTAMSVDPSDDWTFGYTNPYYSSQANANTDNRPPTSPPGSLRGRPRRPKFGPRRPPSAPCSRPAVGKQRISCFYGLWARLVPLAARCLCH